MEALVVVGLVGNAVQFVDFSSKVVGKARHLNKASNGCLPQNADTEVVARTLYALNSKIKGRIPLPCEGGEEVLYEICLACDQVTQELLTALQKLKVKGTNTKWKSLRHALKSVWNKEEIDGMRERLDSLRSQLDLNVLTMLR
ncbi:hypothetical protein BJ875DRAFT_122956 [Amylocarpus encephaloides]|uniref:NACHT-NTPase and P-loop NTPases N-terminal domain-containing protein n=1 Tax=Amylocarpus encephaloides TaxID=45428 RepID=A0A9P8C3U3_9HELO|nr:hypothetical protein BJ875DRAFT_122956 [Amylocarpus encephaloides]